MLALGSSAYSQGSGLRAVPLMSVVDSSITRRLDYRLLVRALERYRVLAADSSIPAFATPSSRAVRPGDSLATVRQLRRRLIALGDLLDTAASGPSGRYAGPVVNAVRRFQVRHGLDDDGVIGPKTVAALQYPLSMRLPQIEQSLDRMRREPPTDGGPFITVNAAAFRLFAFEGTGTDSAPTLDMRVIVGRAVRTPTPTLAGKLRYLEFRPYWNVPTSILVKEILPKLRRDAGWLHRESMELVGQDDVVLGDTVTPATMDALRAGQMRVRQRPGGSNPLGLVKFDFPNESSIYLHDTPSKSLFAQTRRDFSHGCIRLEGARDLARWVMRGSPAWNDDSLDAAMASPVTRRVSVPRAIPVHVGYNTVLATADGRVWFLPDVYGRDSKERNKISVASLNTDCRPETAKR
ncbi:MAG TPA: L,D-transpeptidase family protein [Gemmatimonadaceae bacterium]